MTAIAAVLASSIPANAQGVAPPEIPVTETASPATVTPDTPMVPDTTVTPATDPAAAPVSITPPINPVILHDAPQVAEPAAQPHSVAPRTARQAARPTAAATKTAPVSPAPVPRIERDAPQQGAPPQPETAVSEPAAAPIPAQEAQPGLNEDNGLIVPGAAALGLLALIGGAFALRRRKQSGDDGETAPFHASSPVDDPVMPVAAYRARPAFAPVGMASSASIPDGFDISRFGPHVQAAYRGPTADNPSLSLKRRLKRARFFDKQDRLAAARSDAVEKAVGVRPVQTRAPSWFRTPEVTIGGYGRTKVKFEPAI